jgi:hypothetical protein
MLIRITESSAGCVYEPGQLLKMGDKQGQHLVDKGLAEIVEQEIPEVPRRSQGRPKPSTHMLPPRHIAPDGRVFKNQFELDQYRETL